MCFENTVCLKAQLWVSSLDGQVSPSTNSSVAFFLKWAPVSSAGFSKSHPSQASCGLCVWANEWANIETNGYGNTWALQPTSGSVRRIWLLSDHICVWLQGILNTAAQPPMNVRSQNGGASPVKPVASWNASKWGCWKKVRCSCCLSWPGNPGLVESPRANIHLCSQVFPKYLYIGFLEESGWAITKKTIQRGGWF